jgi:hypothetical protein
VLLLKPHADTKAAQGLVESRNRKWLRQDGGFGVSFRWSLECASDLASTEQRIGKRVECIAIDEGQFVADCFFSPSASWRWGTT